MSVKKLTQPRSQTGRDRPNRDGESVLDEFMRQTDKVDRTEATL
jgi:hypothetical protein